MTPLGKKVCGFYYDVETCYENFVATSFCFGDISTGTFYPLYDLFDNQIASSIKVRLRSKI